MKVMFLHVSVCPHAGGGHVWQGDVHAGGHAWQGACVAHLPADTMTYGQSAGGTHPTGMHSCGLWLLLSSL